jgi:hypothetical protein
MSGLILDAESDIDVNKTNSVNKLIKNIEDIRLREERGRQLIQKFHEFNNILTVLRIQHKESNRKELFDSVINMM